MLYEEARIGRKVKSLREFVDIPKGTTGVVANFYFTKRYGRGLSVIWDGGRIKDGFNEDELESLEFLK